MVVCAWAPHQHCRGADGVSAAAGGVTKEWFQLLIRELFQPAFGMFEYVEETREFWLSPAASHIGVSKEDFRMVGIVLGLAIFNGVILDAHFPLVRAPPLFHAPLAVSRGHSRAVRRPLHIGCRPQSGSAGGGRLIFVHCKKNTRTFSLTLPRCL